MSDVMNPADLTPDEQAQIKKIGPLAFFQQNADKLRRFSTGATRDQDATKIDFEGFLSPLSLERYGEYMSRHRVQVDGSLRASDNWQKGIPQDVYVKSLIRHTFDVHMEHRGYSGREDMENDLCGVIFNAMGLLHEVLKNRGYKQKPGMDLNVYTNDPGNANRRGTM